MNTSVILLHGAIGAGDQLEHLVHLLQKQGRDVHMLTLSGHGTKPFNNAGFGIPVFAAELQQYIAAKNLQQPAVFGYSMGGYVALYAAQQHPNLLGTIVTLATKFQWTPEIARAEGQMLDPDAILEKIPKFADALKARHGEGWRELLAKTQTLMAELGDGKHALDFPNLNTKVYLGLGDRDKMVSLDETLNAYRSLPNAGLYMLPDTKHPIEGVNKELLADLLNRLLI